MAETNFWQQIWAKEKPWTKGQRNPDFDYDAYFNSLPEGVRQDMQQGGKTQSPMGDAAMLGLTYAAVRRPGLALEAIGADPKSFTDASLYQIDNLRMAGALGQFKNRITQRGEGLKRVGWALKTIVENPRQAELAGTGIVGDIGRVSDDFTPSNVFQSKSYTAEAGNTEIIRRQQSGKKLSTDIDPDELIRRKTLKDPGFKMDRKQLKSELLELQDKGMSFEDAKKQLLGDEPFWIDNRTGEPIALQYNTKDPTKPYMPGQWSRRQRGGKRTLLTEQQSLGPDEIAFTKYNAKTNKVELLVKKGDEIHHWNSIIDKSSAYVGLNTQEAKELTGLVREAGWMFGDNKANLIKMIRGDHKKIHAFMRENGIEGVAARKMMEKLYAGKSVKERFKILRGFMEHVQGAVDEELVRMGYQIPPSHAAAQAANREVLKTIKMP